MFVRNLAAFHAAVALTSCATVAPDGLAAFEATLAAQDSATAALTQWCAKHDLAPSPIITAVPVTGETTAIPDEVRRLLEVGPDEAVGFRHVRLNCGDVTLSDARNWFVPGRLTDDMNQTLNSTRVPFGRVVAPLGFLRQRMDAHRGSAQFCPDDIILSHRARLVLPDGRPISVVAECYTSANLVH